MHIYAVIFQGINQERAGLHINESLCCVHRVFPLKSTGTGVFQTYKVKLQFIKQNETKISLVLFVFVGWGIGAFWGVFGTLSTCILSDR